MKTMKWLIRREVWEHKGMFFWAPLVASVLILLAVAAVTVKTASMHELTGTSITINGRVIDAHVHGVPPEFGEKVGAVWSSGYLLPAVPVIVLMTIAVFFYCLGTLYDERRDRSILFWKSLPVSDRETVLSKVATATVVVPLYYLAVGFVLSVAVLGVTGVVLWSAKGLNLLPYVLSNGATYTAPLLVVGMLPVYVLWALPTVGWLMMVSGWARSKVFLWAVGLPFMALVVLRILAHLSGDAFNADWFVQNVLGRLLGGLVPGTWIGVEDIPTAQLVDPATQALNLGRLFSASWGTLLAPSVWIGAAAGVAMLAAAVRIRRWRDEG